MISSPSHQLTPTPPPRIQALSKSVVDRIAAGEVIQRPAAITKELIENSLDAQSTIIDIIASNGGLSYLSVTDNGIGFHKDDLILAATRFATSKLVKFDDLKSIKTFGFRGEALASASMVGRLSIVSRRRRNTSHTNINTTTNNTSSSSSNSCAYKLTYTDGKPNGKPMPSAGKEGTQVKIEDLFYNIPSRRRAFEGNKRENEEYYKLMSVVQRYAVHCSKDGVGFICRKRGGTTDLNTTTIPSIKKLKEFYKNENNSTKTNSNDNDNRSQDALVADTFQLDEQKLVITAMKETIGHVFGSQLTRELLPLEASEGDVEAVEIEVLKQKSNNDNNCNSTDDVPKQDSSTQGISHPAQLYENINITSCDDQSKISNSSLDKFAFKAFGLLTNASYCGSKSSSAFILFINDRLVESAPIRRSIEGIYNDILPRGAKPFVYLSLHIPGIQIDVNIHPTKREVAILHEEKLCSELAGATMKLLCSPTTSKTFYTQALLPTKPNSNIDFKGNDSEHKSDSKMRKTSSSNTINVSVQRKKEIQAKDLIRIDTAAEKGSIEPFLAMPLTKKFKPSESEIDDSPQSVQVAFEHSSDCEFASVNGKKLDLNIPGSFASICRCQIQRPGFVLQQQSVPTSVPRPKKITQTDCTYSSIKFLRNDIVSRSHQDLTSKLRDAVFVGCVSRHRSLLQSGIELLIINHIELARELFYQLALLQFGGFQFASLGNDGIDVLMLVEKALKFEDSSSLMMSQTKLTESDSNIKTAVQVTQCLENNGKSEVYLVNNNFCVLIFTFFTIHFFTFASCNVSRVLFNQI